MSARAQGPALRCGDESLIQSCASKPTFGDNALPNKPNQKIHFVKHQFGNEFKDLSAICAPGVIFDPGILPIISKVETKEESQWLASEAKQSRSCQTYD